MNFLRTTVLSLALLVAAPVFAGGEDVETPNAAGKASAKKAAEGSDKAVSNYSEKLAALMKNKKAIGGGILVLGAAGVAGAYAIDEDVRDAINEKATQFKKFVLKHKLATGLTTTAAVALAFSVYTGRLQAAYKCAKGRLFPAKLL